MATIFIKKISVAYKQRKRKDLASIFFLEGELPFPFWKLIQFIKKKF